MTDDEINEKLGLPPDDVILSDFKDLSGILCIGHALPLPLPECVGYSRSDEHIGRVIRSNGIRVTAAGKMYPIRITYLWCGSPGRAHRFSTFVELTIAELIGLTS